MNIFENASKKIFELISKNSDGVAVYYDDLISVQMNIIINHDVDVIGNYGELTEKITTIDVASDNVIKIGGLFTLTNGYVYLIDAFIANDGFIQTVSVVKQ